MVYSLYGGALGFLFLLLYDLSQLRSRKMVTVITSCIGFGGVSVAVFFEFFLYPPSFIFSPVLIFKVFLALFSAGLLIYSVFIETAPQSGVKQKKFRYAVTEGTYGIVRHPGFLWFLLLQLSVVWLCGSREVMIIACGLTAMNFILVVVEDRWIFPRLFLNYEEYRRKVPMIIPRPGRVYER